MFLGVNAFEITAVSLVLLYNFIHTQLLYSGIYIQRIELN